MMFIRKFILILILFSVFSCSKNTKLETFQNDNLELSIQERDSIVDSVMTNIKRFHLYSEGRRLALDAAIKKHPKIAYFYQQRAMPLYKQDKDEIGLPFLEKAAELDPQKYVEYMAFMKCIFSKNYKDAIIDFNKALIINGESYVMDHSYYFYLGLCNLQLNEFEKAEDYFEKSINQSIKEEGEDWVHFTDLMYLGIAKYELAKFESAVEVFDKALKQQPEFSDVKYYKALSLFNINKIDDGKKMFLEAKEDFLNNKIMQEDNTVYEYYPYQVRKQWLGL